MKICDIVLNSVWYDPRVTKQIKEYVKRHELVCIGIKDIRYDRERVSALPCRVELLELDSKYYKSPSVFQKIKREWLKLIRFRDMLIQERPDVIHANDFDVLFPAYLAKKKLNCVLIYDSHEIFVENQRISSRRLLKWLYTRLESFLIRRVDQVVCVSHAAADYLAEKYRIEPPMVVTNCVSECWSDAKDAIADDVLFFDVLNHGQYYAGRGYDIMAHTGRLLEKYPEIRLVVRGYGPMEEQLRGIVDQEGVQNFLFAPPVTVSELIPAARSARVGVAITEPICINFERSVSNKIFEYAAAGLPVIMSDIPEHRYLNDTYRFGIVLPENTPEALAQAILTLYQSPELYQELKSGAYRFSHSLYWEKEFSKLIQVEIECLKKK